MYNSLAPKLCLWNRNLNFRLRLRHLKLFGPGYSKLFGLQFHSPAHKALHHHFPTRDHGRRKGFFQGGALVDFSKFFPGGPKVVQFVSSHSKLRKQPFLLKISKWPPPFRRPSPQLILHTSWRFPVGNHHHNLAAVTSFLRPRFAWAAHVYVTQARNQLGTPGGAKSFPRGAQIFWTMSNIFKLCPKHLSRGSEKFAPPGYGPDATLSSFHNRTIIQLGAKFNVDRWLSLRKLHFV